MAVYGQAETLFDISPDGAVVFPDVQEPEPVVDLHDPAVWQDGVGRMLTQGERALIIVGPTEVSTAAYAGHITMALAEIAKSNRDRGFVKASQSPDHRSTIEAWGGAHTDDVASELDYRALTGERRARYEFFAASGLGYLAIRPSNRLSGQERLARNQMDDMWGGFRDRYGGTGPEVRRRRATLTRNLAHYGNTEDTVS